VQFFSNYIKHTFRPFYQSRHRNICGFW